MSWLPGLGVLLCAPAASAFTFQSLISAGSNERISADALLAVREEGRAPPSAYSSGQDGEQGAIAALAACRRFIKGKLLAALDGLDSRGVPDPSKRGRICPTLAIRGSVEIDLPVFYLRMGEAMHATQDGFTHVYRTPTGREATVVLNWVDHVDDKLVESRDGPPHLGALDERDDADAARVKSRANTMEASTDLLMLPTPQLRGPLVCPQDRFTTGLQWGAAGR